MAWTNSHTYTQGDTGKGKVKGRQLKTAWEFSPHDQQKEQVRPTHKCIHALFTHYCSVTITLASKLISGKLKYAAF